MNPARIQADTMGFADRFVTAMSGVYEKLERRAITPQARDAAHQLKTDLALGAISNAVNPRPVAGLIDMTVFVTLLRQIAEDPWSSRTFGDEAAGLVEALRRQEADILKVARQYLTDPQLAEIRDLAQRWRQAHPDDRSVSHVHLADLPEANLTPEAAGNMPTSVFGLLFFDPTANLDPAVREIELSRATSERMFFYLQRMPQLLQLQAEGFYRRMLEAPELRRALEDVSAVAGSTTRFSETSVRFAEVSGRFTDTIEKFPAQLTEEREQALKQAAAALTQQREATIRELAEAVAVQRQAAITQATTRFAAEREDAVAQTASAFRAEQQAFVANLEAATDRSISRLIHRAALLGVGLLVLACLAALALLLFTRRRPARRLRP
jgi:hypothetical protein